MKVYNALSGLREGEFHVLGKKLDFLASQISPETQEARFDRVVRIEGLPNWAVGSEGRVDLERLLRVRESSECVEFRNCFALSMKRQTRR